MEHGADITGLLHAARDGDRSAVDRVFGVVYEHLRGLARAQRRRNAADTLSTTALVNEAYLKLAGGAELALESREHFFNLAARAMRQVLLDRARALGAGKRPEGRLRVTLDAELGASDVGALSAEL